eukprot:TRINITY_DN2545_c0_g1_i2.p1 TRINITY_DN2545_c0_g1~~TRINITY_DN2545_c0_g1_i2.p1  ORF type:complete len:187 (-),score=27.04 TRINITY_DN2545_c0_g1_i2:124-684(-)
MFSGELPVCGGCHQPIQDYFISAFNMFWHPNHLACFQCHRDFSDGGSVNEGEDGYAYCEACHTSKVSPQCGGCEKTIDGQYLNAVGKAWHKDCFACTTCKKPISTNFFPDGDGKVYCEKHFYEAQGLWCAGCEAPILAGKLVRMGEKVYHPDHFKCTYCQTGLNGKAYCKKNDKPYCEKCNLVLFG